MSYDAAKFRAEMERDEGDRLTAYDDKTGKIPLPGHVVEGWISIAIGRNLVGKGIRPDERDLMFANDKAEFEGALDTHVPWWRSMSDARQRGLLNLCWMGWGDGSHGLSSFKNMLAALHGGDCEAEPPVVSAIRDLHRKNPKETV